MTYFDPISGRRLKRAKGLVFLASLGLSLGLIVSTIAQRPFQNLNFEDAKIPDIPAGSLGNDVLATNAIPGWDFSDGDTIGHNSVTIGGPGTIIYGPTWRDPTVILSGKYSIGLFSGPGELGFGAGIAQTATFSTDVKSLGFYALPNPGLEIFFNGKQIPFTLLGPREGYDAFGADISAFAGQTGTLLFRTPVGRSGHAYLDDIRLLTTINIGPWLTLSRSSNALRISWPTWAADQGYTLESSASATGEWSAVNVAPVREEKFVVVTIPESNGPLRIYRLIKK